MILELIITTLSPIIILIIFRNRVLYIKDLNTTSKNIY
jgi:hypothetical protein